MAEFEVRSELQRLGHGNVTPGLEHHHSDWASGEGISDDQFSNNIEPDLLISDGLNHADGNNVEE